LAQRHKYFAQGFKEYCDEAHLSTVKVAIQYSETLLQSQDDEVPDYEGKDKEDDYSRLQNPTKTPIILKDFLKVLPHCPIIHWASQMKNSPKLCFCPCSNSSQSLREKRNILIDDDHGCKATAMTPQELYRQLKNEGDCTLTAISIYLETLNSFSRGHVRQDPVVNLKKKPDSDEEEKEEEREEKEEEVAGALDNNDVSCEQVDTYACDHSKQGLETQIASETHKDLVSEVTDGCESAKNVLDDIEKDVTDATGQKEVMGGSVQVENQFSHDNIDENANDQSKHQLDSEIGTKNTEGPESECKDGGDTSINVQGDNVGTDVISPQEGASDDKSYKPPVLPSNPSLSGKLLGYQQFLESKNNKKKRK
jgi:hypothetical protein